LLDKAYRVGIDQGLPFFSDVQVPFHRGYHLALLGSYQDAAMQFQESCNTWLSLGAGIAVPHSLAYWAEAEGRLGRPAEGLKVIDQAFQQINRPGWQEQCHLAEILRVQGWLYQELGQTARAEECLLASLQWARGQQARGWELRAANTLAALWASGGRGQAAYELLRPIYDSFDQGFDTKDLKTAKALLARIS
jgi:tetratricopeptide (TPR) repeat protein